MMIHLKWNENFHQNTKKQKFLMEDHLAKKLKDKQKGGKTKLKTQKQ